MQLTPQVIFVGKLFETISFGVPISALRSASPHLYCDYNNICIHKSFFGERCCYLKKCEHPIYNNNSIIPEGWFSRNFTVSLEFKNYTDSKLGE